MRANKRHKSSCSLIFVMANRGLFRKKPYTNINTHVTIFARYAMLAFENRTHRDERSFGKLFYDLRNELPDIEFAEAFVLLMKAFYDAAAEKLFLAKEELDTLFECFISKLPETFKNETIPMDTERGEEFVRIRLLLIYQGTSIYSYVRNLSI